MPVTTDYLATLKIQLDAAAANKKIALDAAYERATNVFFDTEGKMSTRQTPAKNDAAPGTLDVQYAEQQKNIGFANEASGTLKSGEFARDLATSQAGYRSTVAGLNADRNAGITAAETDAASEYAKYMAMYGKPDPATPTTPAAGGGGAGGGDSVARKPTTPKDPTDNAPVTLPPVFNKPNTIPESTYTNMTPEQKAAVSARNDAVDANGRSGMGASAPIDQKKQVTSNKPSTVKPVSGATGKAISAANTRAAQQVTFPVTKKPVVTPPKKLVPVPKRIGGY